MVIGQDQSPIGSQHLVLYFLGKEFGNLEEQVTVHGCQV